MVGSQGVLLLGDLLLIAFVHSLSKAILFPLAIASNISPDINNCIESKTIEEDNIAKGILVM
jgi:hypothetical protein